MKLRVLKSALRSNVDPPKRRGGSAEKRASYSVRTARRLRLWTRDPHCAICRILTDYPWGFELDHIIPLEQGGDDSEQNSQVLCVHWETRDGKLTKLGCHAEKTASERAQTYMAGEVWQVNANA